MYIYGNNKDKYCTNVLDIEWSCVMSSDIRILSGGKIIGYFYGSGRTYSLLALAIIMDSHTFVKWL